MVGAFSVYGFNEQIFGVNEQILVRTRSVQKNDGMAINASMYRRHW